MRKLYICLEKKVINFFTYSFPFSSFSFSHSFPLHLFHLFGMLLLFILPSLLQSLILFFFPNKYISIFCYKYSANQKTTQLKKACKIIYINIGWFMPPAVTLPYLTSLIKRCYVCMYLFLSSACRNFSISARSFCWRLCSSSAFKFFSCQIAT